MKGYIIGLGSMWILADAVYSLFLYVGKPQETWLKCHSIRIIRGLWAIVFMVIGATLI